MISTRSELLGLLCVSAVSLAAWGDNQQAPSTAETAPDTVADTVYTNGRIYRVNEAQPWAAAVAIKDGKLLVVGSTTKDKETGSLDAGKYADMIVLDRNIFEIDPLEIANTKVLKTVFAGQVVYEVE